MHCLLAHIPPSAPPPRGAQPGAAGPAAGRGLPPAPAARAQPGVSASFGANIVWCSSLCAVLSFLVAAWQPGCLKLPNLPQGQPTSMTLHPCSLTLTLFSIPRSYACLNMELRELKPPVFTSRQGGA